MKYYLAIDIGASSGRHIVGWRESGKLQTKEVYRFPNGVQKQQGHLVWDVEAIFAHVVRGIGEAIRQFGTLESLSVDTWGVDYVLLRGEKPVLPCHAYRDARTDAAIERAHKAMPFEELYRRTGCQFQPFTSVYQLCDDLARGRLEGVTDMLMLPEYLMYRLTGVKAREYTEATTTGLVSAATGEFDTEILDALGLPKHLFPALTQPGKVLGELLPEVAAQVGGSCRVTLCATHDTASAVEGIPMEGDAPYISSGTWSLLGVKMPKPLTDEKSRLGNWANEGGVGYIRYQKNIIGMWLLNRLRDELTPELSPAETMELARKSKCEKTVDANAPAFLAPVSMKAAFDEALGAPLSEPGDYYRVACRSLALCYRDALRELAENTGAACDRLYIVGGGAKNELLNELTAEATGMRVIALPIEATALGNLKVQMEAKT